MNSLNLQNLQFTTLAKTKGQLISVNPPYKKSISIVVKKIVAVYQLQYKNGGIYGIGDFIRGCFCLIRLCKDMNLDFDVDLSNHPLSTYLEGHIKSHLIDYNNISKIEIDDNFVKSPNLFYKTYKDLLKDVNNEVYYTTTNTPPLFEINQQDIDFIKSKFMPNVQMQYVLKNEMSKLELKCGKFSVLHIRAGDNCLFNDSNVLPKNIVFSLFNNLTPLLNNKSCKYLILSDSTRLKKLFESYENCVFQIKPIAHLGNNHAIKYDAVKNTLVDFYLMSQSSHIYSYSVYTHGSGFSKWCAILYNIPYDTYYINNDNNTTQF